MATVKPLAVGVEDAATMVGVKKTMLYALVSEGRLRTFKIGRKTMFKVSDLERFIEEL